MKYLKMLGLTAIAAMAMMAVTAGSASATTLEVTGATQNGPVEITASIKSGNWVLLKDTAGFNPNTCTVSHVSGTTATPYSASSVTAPVSTLTFEGCTRPVEVKNAGKLEVTYTTGTNGTVASEEAEVIVGTAIGKLTCKTGATTNIGTLNGVASGHATMTVSAVLNCGIVPSATWSGEYTITAPHGLGVSA